ncbi:MAG TPA: Crp/Fnr family transcriptional regulator [Candidatus Saccharimonadales bacterium]|nr:Crp/Fnr family transcriptional regulator [Candidatus Saccharimonadales bacterium]
MNILHHFLSKYSTEHYEKGEVILQQDSEPSCALVVKKGVVKTYNLTSKGEEKPIGFTTKNELFPLGWIFNKIRRAQYYYEALSDCEVYSVPKDELVAYIQANPEAMLHILNRCVRDTVHSQLRINALGQSKASDKVLHTMHYLALCFGRDLQKDIVEIPLPLTQQDVANFTGLTRETISVELKKLASREVIFQKNRNYVVLTDKLNHLLDDGYEQHIIRQT